MAESNGMVLTRQGLKLLAETQTGIPLIFTKVVLGDGTIETDLKDLTSLKSPKMEVSIQDIAVTGDGQSRIRVLVSNSDLPVGFFIREIGVFAKNIGDDETEILYSIYYDGDYAGWLPPKGGPSIVEYSLDLITVIGNAENVTAIINESLTFATKEDLHSLIVFSPTRPTGNWTLWLQDLGEVPDFISEGDTALELMTAPIDAPGDFAIVDNTGAGETVVNMTDNQQSAREDDIILADN